MCCARRVSALPSTLQGCQAISQWNSSALDPPRQRVAATQLVTAGAPRWTVEPEIVERGDWVRSERFPFHGGRAQIILFPGANLGEEEWIDDDRAFVDTVVTEWATEAERVFSFWSV